MARMGGGCQKHGLLLGARNLARGRSAEEKGPQILLSDHMRVCMFSVKVSVSPQP